MSMKKTIKTVAVTAISAQMILVGQMSAVAQAEIVTTEAAISKYAAHADRTFLMDELSRAEVREQMMEMGVDPAEAEARLAALTDEEVRAMVMALEEDPAGANGIIGALFTIFVILLITDILCLTDLFSFTRCAIR